MMVVAETMSQFEYDRYRDIADEGGADQNRPFEKAIVERSREPCGDDEQRQAWLMTTSAGASLTRRGGCALSPDTSNLRRSSRTRRSRSA